FDRLLVEPRSCSKSWIKAIGSDRNEMTMLRHLEVAQPFQGLKGGEHHVVAGHGLSTNQQSVRESRIAIGKPILEPRPIHRAVASVAFQESFGEDFPEVGGDPVPGKAFQVFVDAKKD